MAIIIKGSLTIAFVPDGAGSMEVPMAQSLKLSLPAQVVPGGNAPTMANFVTALQTLAANVTGPAIGAQIGTIQGWATGGN